MAAPRQGAAKVATKRKEVVVFNFGDSNLDTSGVAAIMGIRIALSEGRAFFHHPTGMLSDGRVVLDPHCAVQQQEEDNIRASPRARSSMEKDSHKEGEGATAWMTVTAFGDWDMKNGAMPYYSMDFSKIRQMRKQNKKELSRASLSGDDDLLAHHKQQQQPSKPPAHGGGRGCSERWRRAPSRELEMRRILLDRIDGGAAEEPSCSLAM
ncbi:hypothetical protein ZWY2020_048197 [Hordeum vulgare]|nr:hypothetical protein ZWY2020_048197 [Hordeum vulgare]